MKKRILLINPDYRNETWIADGETPSATVTQDIMPLGLATVAALTPDCFDVEIWDEHIRGRITEKTSFKHEYHLVGLTGYTVNLPRCIEIANIFRKRGITVVIGGPGVSGRPYEWRKYFDVMFIGEAEKTWPLFLSEWPSGYRSEYRQIEKPDLSESPVPKWDSIAPDIAKYAMGCVQTTRGCPNDCEFCDVIYLYGRRPRHKPIKNVLDEVIVLQNLGVSKIFFSDDEFIGNPKYAKELLRSLIPLNDSFPRPLTFSTHVSMRLSRSDELLALLSEANFKLLIIGIETPNRESLKESNKHQNLQGDLIKDIHKILSYGMAVLAGIIVGFDHDDKDIFDMQYDFIQKAYLPSVSINMLKAAAGTRLWTRLRQDGRVLDISENIGKGHIRTYTNIIPKRMSRAELMEGFCNLMHRVHTWESFKERIYGFVSLSKDRTNSKMAPCSAEEVNVLIASLNMEPGERKIAEEITAYTAQVAPHLMETVKNLVVNHYKYRKVVAKVIAEVNKQIEGELSGQIKYQSDNRPITIPAPFREVFKKIFPNVHRRVYLNLANKNLIAEALNEIFIDFLTRWGKDFEELNDHHIIILNEICDRTCAKLNGQAPDDFIPILTSDLPVADGLIVHLRDDVLKSVEQELMSLYKQ